MSGTRPSGKVPKDHASTNFGKVTPTQNIAAVSPAEWNAFIELSYELQKTRADVTNMQLRMQESLMAANAYAESMESCIDLVAQFTAKQASTEKSNGVAAEGTATASCEKQANIKRLLWSVSSFRSQVLQLLSPAHLYSYENATQTKVLKGLTRVERGTLLLCDALSRYTESADAPAASSFTSSRKESAAVAASMNGAANATTVAAAAAAAATPRIRDSQLLSATIAAAQTFDQLVVSRLAQSYGSTLLFVVAAVGDFVALWKTANRNAHRDIVWMSSELSEVPFSSSDDVCGLPSSSSKYRGQFSDAVTKVLAAVEQLRSSVLYFVASIYDVLAQFHHIAKRTLAIYTDGAVMRSATATHNTTVLRAYLHEMISMKPSMQETQASFRVRQACYSSILEDHVVTPLRLLEQAYDARFAMTHLSHHLLQKATRKVGTTFQFLSSRISSSRCHSRTSSSLPDQSQGNSKEAGAAPPSPPAVAEAAASSSDVLFPTWVEMATVMERIGSEVSDQIEPLLRQCI